LKRYIDELNARDSGFRVQDSGFRFSAFQLFLSLSSPLGLPVAVGRIKLMFLLETLSVGRWTLDVERFLSDSLLFLFSITQLPPFGA
jgi:hypothetical protein